MATRPMTTRTRLKRGALFVTSALLVGVVLGQLLAGLSSH